MTDRGYGTLKLPAAITGTAINRCHRLIDLFHFLLLFFLFCFVVVVVFSLFFKWRSVVTKHILKLLHPKPASDWWSWYLPTECYPVETTDDEAMSIAQALVRNMSARYLRTLSSTEAVNVEMSDHHIDTPCIAQTDYLPNWPSSQRTTAPTDHRPNGSQPQRTVPQRTIWPSPRRTTAPTDSSPTDHLTISPTDHLPNGPPPQRTIFLTDHLPYGPSP